MTPVAGPQNPNACPSQATGRAGWRRPAQLPAKPLKPEHVMSCSLFDSMVEQRWPQHCRMKRPITRAGENGGPNFIPPTFENTLLGMGGVQIRRAETQLVVRGG